MNEGRSTAHTDPEGYARYEGSVECIEAIRSALTPDEFRGFCKGNAIKYIWREGSKGGTRDIYKAADYLSMVLNGKWMHSEEEEKNLRFGTNGMAARSRCPAAASAGRCWNSTSARTAGKI